MVCPLVASAATAVTVAAAGVVVANSLPEGARPLLDRKVHRRACTRPFHSLGRARCRCGHTVALRLSRPSPPFHSTTGSFGSVPDGGVYSTGYTAPPPYVYGGAVHSPSTFQGPSVPYQAAAQAPWNPTHGGAWNQDSLVQSFNTMSLTPPTPSEWYADCGRW
jgi:hypothetical protein